MLRRGIMTQTFGNIQEGTYRLNNFPKEMTGTTWARNVVRIFLIFFEELWEKRNEIFFSGTSASSEREYLQEKLRKLLSREREIPPNFRTLHQKAVKISTNKKAKISELKRWIDVTSDFDRWKDYQERHDRKIGKHIRQYLNGTNNNIPRPIKRQISPATTLPHKRQRTLNESICHDHINDLNSAVTASIREPNITK